MSATRPARARLLGALAALALVLLWVPVGAGPVAAHAALTGSDPADGSRLDAEPTEVTLTFNEPVRTPAFVVVDAPDGTRLTQGEAEVVDGTVNQQVRRAGQAGRHRIAYRVVSADGHPISGTLRYTVDQPAAAPSEAATDAPTTDAPTAAAEETPSPASADAVVADGSFWSRHGQHVLWGAGGVVAAAALLLWPWRRARD